MLIDRSHKYQKY